MNGQRQDMYGVAMHRFDRAGLGIRIDRINLHRVGHVDHAVLRGRNRGDWLPVYVQPVRNAVVGWHMTRPGINLALTHFVVFAEIIVRITRQT